MSDNGTDAASTLAARIKTEAQRAVDLGNGLTMQIRCVGIDEVMASGIFGPMLTGKQDNESGMEKIAKVLAEDDQALIKTIDVMLNRGMASPRVWQGIRKKCPSDEVMLEDLARHRMRLYQEIMDFSGWSVEVSEAASFRDRPGQGEGVPEAREADGADTDATVEGGSGDVRN